jgi:putative DNA primase/helicase
MTTPGTAQAMSLVSVDSIRAAVSANPQRAFEAILGESLTRKAGSKEPVAHCHFHEDTRPSLRCNLDKATWYCDPCGKGGDVFNLAKRIWNVEFMEAAKRLGGLLAVSQNGHRPSPTSNGVGKDPREVIRTFKYEIRDLQGEIKATHIRIEYSDGSKSMPWEPVGVKPAELPLYGINRTADSTDGEAIIVCEGEKPADSLWERGILAVGTVTGAGLNKQIPCDESLKPLKRFKVYLWPDNDDHGRDHMERIGKRLIDLDAREVFKIKWKEAPPRGDAAEYKGDVDLLLDTAEPFDAPQITSIAFSEDQVALDFAARYAGNLHYVPRFNRWYSWNSAAWREDGILKVYDLGRAVCREIAIAAKNKRIKAALTAARTVNAIVGLSRSDQRIAIPHDALDADPWLLNTPGGVVDLHTGKMRPNRRGDLMTKLTAVAPADHADCPLWLAFLTRIMQRDDPEVTDALIAYLQRLFGYCLTGVTTEALIAFAHGGGANGKTTGVTTFASAMGDYARAVAAETFLASKNERHPTEIANLMGARLVVASEIGRGRAWNESRLNELTGGDRVSARFMRGDFFEFAPIFKPLIVGNHKPAIRSVNEATRRRLHLLPFTVTIPIAERDTELSRKLRNEWPGILRWAIEGCLDWQREGLNPPGEVRAATEHYLAQEDTIGRWLEECIERDLQAFTTIGSLYDSFKAWAEAAQEYVISKKALSQSLEDLKFGYAIKEKGRGFNGLRLRSPGTML